MNIMAFVQGFENDFVRVEKYINTANSRGDQLHWANYRKWYLLNVRKAKTAFRQLCRIERDVDKVKNHLERMETLLATMFDIKTQTRAKYEALQQFKPIWNKFKDEAARQLKAKYDMFSERDFGVEENLCFVLMPFDKTFGQVYKEAIKPAVRGVGLKCRRADDIFGVRPIVQDIWEYINRAKVVVADLTDRNPNVFYEVGLSHALAKKVVLLTQKPQDVPFDIKHIRYVLYKNDASGRGKLLKALSKTIRGLVG